MTDLITNLIKIFPPEFAHYLTINLLKLSFSDKNYSDNPILNQHLLGLDFSNPIGLAAGFDKDAEVINPMINLGFGFVEVGTITPKFQSGNIKPIIIYTLTAINQNLNLIQIILKLLKKAIM